MTLTEALTEALAALVAAGKIRSAWLPGMRGWYAPRGSEGRRWDLEAGKARAVRVLLAGASDEPAAVRFVTADGETLQSGARVADCVSDSLVPDIADPLTVFGLLLLAREAWGDPSLTPMPIDESIPLQWDWCDDGLLAPALMSDIYYRPFDSEADAIVAAIIVAAEALEVTP